MTRSCMHEHLMGHSNIQILVNILCVGEHRHPSYSGTIRTVQIFPDRAVTFKVNLDDNVQNRFSFQKKKINKQKMEKNM